MLLVRNLLKRCAGVFSVLVISLLLWPIIHFAPAALAHPADMYFQSHTLRLSPSGVRLEWSPNPGPLLSYGIWSEADRDENDVVNPDEALAWVESRLPALTIALDQNITLDWRLESVEWPSSLADFQMGDAKIIVYLAADWPSNLAGRHNFRLYNNLEENLSIDWFYLYGDEGLTFQTPSQQRGLLVFDFVIPEAGTEGSAGQSASGQGLLSYWESGTPAVPVAGEFISPTSSEEGSTSSVLALHEKRTSAILTDLVRTEDLSPTFYLVALLIALVLGSLHALTPGHGKTVVAAYLVGSRGTVRHAISLGLIVTLTHTGSVLALGLLTLVASQYIVPTSLFPILEIASGLLIIGLGLHLLRQRWRAWRHADTKKPHHHHHSHPHSHSHPHPHDHDHQPDFTHDHHQPPDVQEVSWSSLVTLGISGGLVPCPDAIAILLVALTINRITLGLTLIVAFSLGLALVLIVIGVAMVHGGRLLNNVRWFDRLAPVVPILSTVVVLVLGIGLTWNAARSIVLNVPDSSTTTATTSPGAETTDSTGQARDEYGQQSLFTSFHVDQASILYLGLDERGLTQLLVLPLAGSEPVPLTTEPLDVWDYSLAPDGVTVVYSTQSLGGQDGAKMWAIKSDGSQQHMVLDCPAAGCTGASWSPDGRRLIYQKEPQASLTEQTPLPRLWWLDTVSGETGSVFQDNSLPGLNPNWSPDGLWLSYLSPGTNSIQVYNLQDGRRFSIPSQTGSSTIWHPKSEAVLTTDVRIEEGQATNHLLRLDLDSAELIDLSQRAAGTDGALIDDGWPSWSPSGDRIALVRRYLADSGASKGDQIWLIYPDGSPDRQITNEENLVHQAPVWSPDGRYLLFQQYRLKQPGAQQEIWLVDLETGESRSVVAPGRSPAWLP